MISLDGVSESKSTTNSEDVYSSRFKNCRNIYPHRIVRPLNRYPVDNRHEFSSFLEDLNINSYQVTDFVGDNPKRSFVREALNHASYYACEYCDSKAIQFKDVEENRLEETRYKEQTRDIQQKIDLLLNTPGTSASKSLDDQKIVLLTNIKNDLEKEYKKKLRHSHLVWPSSTNNGRLRTIDEMKDIVHQIDMRDNGDRGPLGLDESKGFTGHSLLLDMDEFDFTKGISCEYMHCVCLGAVKRLLILTFNLGEKRIRCTTRRLSNPAKYNDFMKGIKVPKEFSRRARNLDISVLKAQEMRNITLFFFPVIVECIEKNAKERKLWLLLAFIVRACCLPNNEFENVLIDAISNCARQFYTLYEQLFSTKNCTYNTHVFASHILDIRTRGPLTLTSAFSFEAFYAELRHSFTPGTISPLKQMLQNVMMRRSLNHHCCISSIHLSPKDTQLECNSLIYTFDNDRYTLYLIESIDVHNDDNLNCYRLGRYPVNFQDAPLLNWESVGVFRIGGISEDCTTIQRSAVKGKVLKVLNFYITCPSNVLREK